MSLEKGPPIIDHRFRQILLFCKGLEDGFVNGLFRYEVNVSAAVFLPYAVYPAQGLAVGGKIEIHAIINASVRRCEGDSGPGCVDLAYKDRGGRVRLELLNDCPPFLFLYVAVYAPS